MSLKAYVIHYSVATTYDTKLAGPFVATVVDQDEHRAYGQIADHHFVGTGALIITEVHEKNAPCLLTVRMGD